jgi:23S rRNA pseudouridine2457 synthase
MLLSMTDEHVGGRTRDRTIAVYKPYGMLSCFTDPKGRPTLAEIVDIPKVYPAGRLDFDSEGLLLLTSDGRLVRRITDPTFHLTKVYWAQVEGEPGPEALERLRTGVVLSGRRTRPAQVALIAEPKLPARSVPIRFRKSIPTSWLRISIQEGMNRQVRRMTAAVGYPTLRLVRVSIGPVMLAHLQPGHYRELSEREVRQIWRG